MNTTETTPELPQGATQLPRLAVAIKTYKPHSKIVPRDQAVKLWNELKALGVSDFGFKAMGHNRTIVRYMGGANGH